MPTSTQLRCAIDIQPGEPQASTASPNPNIVDVPEVFVRLDSGESDRTLKATFSVEIADENRAAIDAKMPHLQETIVSYLANHKPKDLDGSVNMENVKAEILTKINADLGDTPIKNLYIKDWVSYGPNDE